MYKHISRFSNVFVCIRVFAISTCRRKLSWRKSEIPRTSFQAKNRTPLFRLLYISRIKCRPFSSCIFRDLICSVFLRIMMASKTVMQLCSTIMLIMSTTVINVVCGMYYHNLSIFLTVILICNFSLY